MLAEINNAKGFAFRSYATQIRRNQVSRESISITCSLGPQNSRGSSNYGSSGKSLDSQRHRIAAVAVNVPSENKQDSKLSSELQEQADLLEMSYLGFSNEISEDSPDLESEDKEEPKKSSAALFSSYNDYTPSESPEPITVRSTKRQNKKSSSVRKDRVVASLPNETKLISTIPLDPQDAIDGDELAADAVFVTALRDWLRTSRRAQRSTRRPSSIAAPNMVAVFLASLGNTPVLSAKQERYLARIIARGNTVRKAATTLAKNTGSRPSLDVVATAAGLPSAQSAARAVLLAEDARGLMVEFNLRFVVSIAKRYVGNGVDLSDLIPEGITGLRKAIDKFDHAKGFKFSTYAHWWVRQSISRAISDQGRDVRLPVHIIEFLSKVRKVTEALKAEPDRTTPPTFKEIAVAMGVPLDRLVSVVRAARTPKSPEDLSQRLNTAGIGEDVDVMDVISDIDEGNEDPLVQSERMEYLQETFALLLSTLPVRERNIIRLRYGLNPSVQTEAIDALAKALMSNEKNDRAHGESSTKGARLQSTNNNATNSSAIDNDDDDDDMMVGLGLAEVGIIHRLSRERIRQIETEALRHLRMPWRVNLLTRVKAGEPLSQDAVERLLQASDAFQNNI